MLENLKLSRFTLKSFIIVTGWTGLLLLIAYIVYKDPQKAIDNYDTLIGFATSILGIAIGKWLFGDRSG
jgi:membrane protein DedA with SNARE-associated domain